jgi:hypothetical protein
MFSHPPCALHPFIACSRSESRRWRALDWDLLAEAQWFAENALNSESADFDNYRNLSTCYRMIKNKIFP